MLDCVDLDCCPESWIGDGYADCEDQAYGCDLTCYDCDGGDCIDACGVCDGDSSSCADCCGVPNGDNSSCGGSGDVTGDGSTDVTDVVVIIGGIKRIAAVASRLVPTMAVLYVAGALLILLTHFENVIPSFLSIFREAFSLKAGWGGLITVIMWGVRRGLYSNEAGVIVP